MREAVENDIILGINVAQKGDGPCQRQEAARFLTGCFSCGLFVPLSPSVLKDSWGAPAETRAVSPSMRGLRSLLRCDVLQQRDDNPQAVTEKRGPRHCKEP